MRDYFPIAAFWLSVNHYRVTDKVKVKVTSLYMPQRASQRKLGKSLQPNLCKQRGGDYDKKEKETEKGLGWRRKGESRMA